MKEKRGGKKEFNIFFCIGKIAFNFAAAAAAAVAAKWEENEKNLFTELLSLCSFTRSFSDLSK